MNQDDQNVAESVELAAGGLVWSGNGKAATICLVRRAHHGDWVLPKGRLKPGESPPQAAMREAMEESGRQVVMDRFAGSYHYQKGGMSKVVLMWRMRVASEESELKSDAGEILQREWLTPLEARKRLTHLPEREFLVSQCNIPADDEADSKHMNTNPKFIRLAAAMSTVRTTLESLTQLNQVEEQLWWATSASQSLKKAEDALSRHDLDGGWSAVHDAERTLTHGLPCENLLTKAIHLRADAGGKVKGWRLNAVNRLFEVSKFDDWLKNPGTIGEDDLNLLRQVVIETMEIFHGHSDNVYHRMHLVSAQLKRMVWLTVVLLVAVFMASYFYAPGTDLSVENLIPVALAGAFGGVVSTMFQLIRVGRAKIPEALLQGIITSGRPLVGAAASLFIYFAMKSEIVSVVAIENISLNTGIVVGFVAGFSERLVLSTVEKIAGAEKKEEENQN
jgi:8-oxo-dGTP pyrophosphatase MutT (NUDIX family)